MLAPLVQHSQEAAEQLVTLGGVHALAELIKQPDAEPLPLSLMLDIVEVLVARGEVAGRGEVRQMLVRDGLLAPILLALRHPGLNRKAVTILTHMVEVRRLKRHRTCSACLCGRIPYTRAVRRQPRCCSVLSP